MIRSIRRVTLAAAVALAAVVGIAVASPAFAAGPTGTTTDNGTVSTTGTVSQVCGFDGSLPSSINLGTMAPAVQSVPVALAYHLRCNDSNGWLTAALGVKTTLSSTVPGLADQLATDIPQNCGSGCSGSPSTWSGTPIYNVTAGLGIDGAAPALQVSPWASEVAGAPQNGIPYALLNGSTTAPAGGTTATISDMWSATLPAGTFYPGLLSGGIGMFVFAQ